MDQADSSDGRDSGRLNRDRTRRAVDWFASVGLRTIRVHRPVRVPTPGSPLGLCSCGSGYRLDSSGQPEALRGLCESPGKHPVDRDWTSGRVRDRDDDRVWNLGLLCGPGGGDDGQVGALVLDVDPRNGGSGTWRALVERLPRLADTMTYWTSLDPDGGDRGLHALFVVREREAWRALSGVRDPAGVNVKRSGMVVTVPSLHASGSTYEWRTTPATGLRTLTPADADELSEALGGLPGAHGGAWSAGDGGDGITHRGDAARLLADWENGDVPSGSLTEGGRNDAMKPLVGALVQRSVERWSGRDDREALRRRLDELSADPSGVPPGLGLIVRVLDADLCRPPLGFEAQRLLHNIYRTELEGRLAAVEWAGGASSRGRPPDTMRGQRRAVTSMLLGQLGQQARKDVR